MRHTVAILSGIWVFNKRWMFVHIALRCCCCCFRIYTVHTNEYVCVFSSFFSQAMCKHCSCSRYSVNVFCKEQKKKTIIINATWSAKKNERISMEKMIALNNFHWIRAHTKTKWTEPSSIFDTEFQIHQGA